MGGSIQKYGRHAWAIARRAVPLAVTVVALIVAASRFDAGSMLAAARALHPTILLWVVILLLCGNLLACLRLCVVARDFGQRLPIREGVVASTAGQLAGSFFFQIIGQTIARSTVLSKSGISMPTTIVITGYERIVAASVSFLLALAGVAYLFGRITFDWAGGGQDFLKMAVGLVLVAASGFVFAWGGLAKRAADAVLSQSAALRLSRVFLISLVIQATTMAAYVAAAQSLPVQPELKDLLAATALVMLAASIPISFAGWGMREISAIYALGAIGVPYDAALLVALLIGSLSILVTAILAFAISLVKDRRASAPVPGRRGKKVDYLGFLAWLLPLAAASSVFFQVFVPVGNGYLNVNLADSVVLFGGALALQQAATSRRPRELFRDPRLGLYLLIMSAVIVLAFFHGWFEFGLTSWALANRLFGWLVVLCYAGTGALLVLREDGEGLRIFLRAFVASGLAVVAFELILVFLLNLGVPLSPGLINPRIEGFAQNANAFAFQILLVAIAIIALRKPDKNTVLPFALTVMALMFAGSRAGQGSFVILALLAIYLRMAPPRWLGLSLVAAGVGAVIVSGTLFAVIGDVYRLIASVDWGYWIAPYWNYFLRLFSFFGSGQIAASGLGHRLPFAAGSGFGNFAMPNFGNFMAQHYQMETTGAEYSNSQHALSLVEGWQMFISHPLFGAGLGAFIQSIPQSGDLPLIIHSTPLWLLAETGIVGLLAFAIPFILMFKSEWRLWFAQGRRHDPAGILLILTLAGFALMAQVHELLYQRAFWLILGAALASLPGRRRQAARKKLKN